jgi:hypothetical protein
MYRILVLSALSAVSALSLPVSSTAQTTRQVTIVYVDGTQRTVTDWRFTYYYGASDQPFTGGTYLQLSKRTTDLLLDIGPVMEDGVGQAEERRLPATDLAAIHYDRGQDADRDVVKRIIVTLANGSRLSSEPPLRPAASMLSTKPFVFATSIWLNGTGDANGSPATFALRLDEPSGNGTVAHVRFEPAPRE